MEKRDYLGANSTTDTSSALNGSNTLTFKINNTQNYLTLFNSYFKIQGKITKSDDSAI